MINMFIDHQRTWGEFLIARTKFRESLVFSATVSGVASFYCMCSSIAPLIEGRWLYFGFLAGLCVCNALLCGRNLIERKRETKEFYELKKHHDLFCDSFRDLGCESENMA